MIVSLGIVAIRKWSLRPWLRLLIAFWLIILAIISLWSLMPTSVFLLATSCSFSFELLGLHSLIAFTLNLFLKFLELLVVFLISRLECSGIIDSDLFQWGIRLLLNVVRVIYDWGTLNTRVLLLRIIISHVIWQELGIARVFLERLLLLLRALLDVAPLSWWCNLAPCRKFFCWRRLSSIRQVWSNWTSFFIDSIRRRITKIGLRLYKLLCEVRINISCFVNVIENMRFILIWPLISSWISSDLVRMSSHTPIFRLCTIYVIRSQISHRLLNWIVWIAVI